MTCEYCGSIFNFKKSKIEFERITGIPYDEVILQKLCTRCALDDISENINRWDAADIWASNGKDEDYMFGYTEEELEDSLY